MFLTIKIDNIVATLYRDGWMITQSDGQATIKQLNELKKFLEIIMEEELLKYEPNIYYAKGKEIEKAIKGAKMLYWLGMYENEPALPDIIY